MYLTNYLAKNEITARDVSRAMRDAAKHFSGRGDATVLQLIRRVMHRAAAAPPPAVGPWCTSLRRRAHVWSRRPQHARRRYTYSRYCGRRETQSAWWQILHFPIIDTNIQVDTISLANERKKFMLRLPSRNIEAKGHYTEAAHVYT